MSEWQPIETAPKDGTLIDIWAMGDDFTGRFPNCEWGKLAEQCGGGHAWLYDGLALFTHYTPTHWQPLPDPPSDLPNDME